MKKIRSTFSLSLVVVSMLLGIAGITNAQRRNDRDIRDAVRSLNSKLDDFEQNARYQMQSSSTNNGQIADLADSIRPLRDSIQQFQDNFDRRRENRDDVNQIVDAARRINVFLQSNPQNRRVEDDWNGVKRQIERLGANYGVTPNWTVEEDPQWVKDYPDKGPLNTVSVGLSGTYDLDSARSENIDDIVADTSLGTEQREDLKDKLVAPGQIAIDIRGNQVTLATSNASPVTFTADGRDKTESSPSGKSIRVRATLNGQSLIVSSLGGDTDYTITFTSLSNGKALKVNRRITTEYLNQTVIAESVYNKTDAVAQLGINPNGNVPDNSGGYSDNDQSGNVPNGGVPSISTSRPGNYVVPNGVTITGILENEINTNVSQNNDRFRLTVQSPVEFRGAVIEGYISGVGRSGKVTGQSNVTFNFERIRLRNGQTHDFAGTLLGIKDQNGKTVKIDNEGTAKGSSQTKETAKRGGLGAGAGAILGAILGGAKGAAVGAVIGGGAGAGSVIVTGKDDIRLQTGSTITVRSSSPVNTGQR
ncbi:MAG: hypothetical protein IPL32_08995 [Chloracidobacterium sp.]|nr:hypothetical protein [Chloracidobacterium sp.]